jgi:hypothetical protein
MTTLSACAWWLSVCLRYAVITVVCCALITLLPESVSAWAALLAWIVISGAFVLACAKACNASATPKAGPPPDRRTMGRGREAGAR